MKSHIYLTYSENIFGESLIFWVLDITNSEFNMVSVLMKITND